MDKREKIIEILKKHTVFTCNPPLYHERQFIRPDDIDVKIYNHCELADKILALDSEKVESDEQEWMNASLGKPQEPVCSCIRISGNRVSTHKICPIHGEKKEKPRKLEYNILRTEKGNIGDCMDAINKINDRIND